MVSSGAFSSGLASRESSLSFRSSWPGVIFTLATIAWNLIVPTFHMLGVCPSIHSQNTQLLALKELNDFSPKILKSFIYNCL